MFQLFVYLTLAIGLPCTSSKVYECDRDAACGCSMSNAITSKIVGGETAALNSWSWAVSILINESALCGGTIISSSWIMTAAHCVEDAIPSEVFISAGSNMIFQGKVTRYASSIVVHPNYDYQYVTNDIALIEVSPPFAMDDTVIKQICLPNVDSIDYPLIGSSVCIYLDC
jgi:secreted trypsin-like serine protease